MTKSADVAVKSAAVKHAKKDKATRQPKTVRRQLQRKVSRALADTGVRLVKHAILRDRIFAGEKLEIIEPLDYQRNAIHLSCRSLWDLERCQGCDKEPETIEWIETFIRPGDVVYDIGANVGAYSLVAAKFTGGKAKIYSFEPIASTFAQLCRNISLNGCQNSITPLQVALSSQTGVVYLCSSDIKSGAAQHELQESIEPGNGSGGAKYVQPTLGYRLDDLVRHFSIDLPDHIKLDVDGNELKVLIGAEQTLGNSNLKSIIIEFDERSSESLQAIEHLKSRGFRVHAKKQHWTTSIWNYVLVKDAAPDTHQPDTNNTNNTNQNGRGTTR